MTRSGLTYRAARRAEWKGIAFVDRPSWAEFNGKLPKYNIGTLPAHRAPRIIRDRHGMIIARFPGQPVQSRSKYTPHIGAKQRAKAA